MASREEMIGKLALRFPGSAASSDQAEEARLRLLIEDTQHLSLDALRIGIQSGVKVWRFMPTAAEICEQAKDVTDWEKPLPFERLAAPEQTYLPRETLQTDALLAEVREKLNVGHRKLMGGDMPGHRAPDAPRHSGPPRAPSADEIAAIKATLSPETGGASEGLKALAAKLGSIQAAA